MASPSLAYYEFLELKDQGHASDHVTLDSREVFKIAYRVRARVDTFNKSPIAICLTVCILCFFFVSYGIVAVSL